MRAIVLISSLLMVVSAALSAAEPPANGWRDEHGNPAPDSESRKSKDGFGGMLLNTGDADWREKWEKPENPNYGTKSDLVLGDKIWTLIFFTNAARKPDGTIDIRCDIKVTRGNGTISADQKDLACAQGKIAGDPYNLQLANVTPGFLAEDTDPAGTWRIEVRLTDAVRKVTLELSTTFELHKP